MECYPPCVNCSGLCKQAIASAPEIEQTRRVASSVRKLNPGYIALTCEHYTTPEEQILIGTKAPKGKSAWCSKCSKWRKRAPSAKIERREEPLF